MSKTYSLSLSDDIAQKIELEAQEAGMTVQQQMRQVICDYLQFKAVSLDSISEESEVKEYLTEQLQQLTHQLDQIHQSLQQKQPQPDQSTPKNLQPVLDPLQKIETQIKKLCEALDKLAALLESDRALVPKVISRQDSLLEAIYILAEKTLLYTSPEDLRETNERLMDEMHSEVEKILKQ